MSYGSLFFDRNKIYSVLSLFKQEHLTALLLENVEGNISAACAW